MVAGIRVILALVTVSLVGFSLGKNPVRARAETTTAAMQAAVSSSAPTGAPGWGALFAGCYCLVLVRQIARSA